MTAWYQLLLVLLAVAFMPTLSLHLQFNECISPGSPLITWFKFSLTECVNACRHTNGCVTVEYNTKLFVCHLHSDHSSNTTVKCNGSVIMHVYTQENIKSFKIFEDRRSIGKTSVDRNEDNAFNFCPRLDSSKETTVVGNMRYTGAEAQLLCRSNGLLRNLNSTCLPNQTWSLRKTCDSLCPPDTFLYPRQRSRVFVLAEYNNFSIKTTMPKNESTLSSCVPIPEGVDPDDLCHDNSTLRGSQAVVLNTPDSLSASRYACPISSSIFIRNRDRKYTQLYISAFTQQPNSTEQIP